MTGCILFDDGTWEDACRAPEESGLFFFHVTLHQFEFQCLTTKSSNKNKKLKDFLKLCSELCRQGTYPPRRVLSDF